MTSTYKSNIKFHIKVERLFVEIRGKLAKELHDKEYTVKEIARTLKTSEQTIYADLRKVTTKNYLEGKK